MTNAYCSLEDVKASLSGDTSNMSAGRDQSLVNKILEVSRDIDRCVAKKRGENIESWSFLAEQQFSKQIIYISSTPDPSSGTFVLDFDGQTTGDIAFNADASAVQSALEALSNVGSGNLAVTGFSGGRSRELADLNAHVNAHNYGVVEDIHMAFIHILTQFLRMHNMDESLIGQRKF